MVTFTPGVKSFRSRYDCNPRYRCWTLRMVTANPKRDFYFHEDFGSGNPNPGGRYTEQRWSYTGTKLYISCVIQRTITAVHCIHFMHVSLQLYTVGIYRYCSMHSDILYLPGTHWLKGIVIETVVLIAIYRYVFFIKVSFAANRILLPLCNLFCFLNSSKDSCPCIRCLYSCIVDFRV